MSCVGCGCGGLPINPQTPALRAGSRSASTSPPRTKPALSSQRSTLIRPDRYYRIGPPKSAAGERTIPLPPTLIKILREWKLACPKGDLDLAFPNTLGRIMDYNFITIRGLGVVEIAADVVTKSGKAKYNLHAMRHFYASWCINRRVDGGLELPLKVVQSRLGHASVRMTADRYGHLFPRGDDGAELAAAEKAFF
jgi:integrase